MSRDRGDVMVESMVLRKPEAASPAAAIEEAVVSSVRRDLFFDRLKCQCTALLFAMSYYLSSFPSTLFSKGSSPYGSVGYNRNVSRVSAHASKSRRTHFTLKRSIRRKRSPPKRAIMSFTSSSLQKHVSVNCPRSGGTERGTRSVSAVLSRLFAGKR